ncbi:hypothetical protein M6B38_176050 [Iris pallida]|uniref:Uncharacterized protein n=1 Tax=Iris pallida TaxID=29817 RepID=A0AAX6EPX9_IRIPA|nr:hypothetical protein M6B38_176050 [Iris pallida]
MPTAPLLPGPMICPNFALSNFTRANVNVYSSSLDFGRLIQAYLWTSILELIYDW